MIAHRPPVQSEYLAMGAILFHLRWGDGPMSLLLMPVNRSTDDQCTKEILKGDCLLACLLAVYDEGIMGTRSSYTPMAKPGRCRRTPKMSPVWRCGFLYLSVPPIQKETRIEIVDECRHCDEEVVI